MTLALVVGGLFLLLLLGVPVAFALGGTGLALLYAGGFSPLMAPQGILSTLDGFILLAVPLFLLMGNVLLKGGVGRDLFDGARDAMTTTVAILLIVAGAKVFGKALALWRVPQDMSAFIGATIDGPMMFILVVSAVLLLMELVFEALSMVLIMTPVLLPAATGLGFDPVWFGIHMVIMVECALVTPPVGLNLYVIPSVARASLADVARGTRPFLLIMPGSVALLYAWPELALYLPLKW